MLIKRALKWQEKEEVQFAVTGAACLRRKLVTKRIFCTKRRSLHTEQGTMKSLLHCCGACACIIFVVD